MPVSDMPVSVMPDFIMPYSDLNNLFHKIAFLKPYYWHIMSILKFLLRYASFRYARFRYA